jgi:hypothetical protein
MVQQAFAGIPSCAVKANLAYVIADEDLYQSTMMHVEIFKNYPVILDQILAKQKSKANGKKLPKTQKQLYWIQPRTRNSELPSMKEIQLTDTHSSSDGKSTLT